MYRTNAQSRSLEDAFVARGVPYRFVGGTRFYQRKEIKDALAYLRLVHNPADNIGLMRVINVPPRSIGDKTMSSLSAWSAELGVSMAGGLALVAGDLASLLLGGYLGADNSKPPQHPFGAAAQRALIAFYRLLKGWVDVKDGLTVAGLLEGSPNSPVTRPGCATAPRRVRSAGKTCRSCVRSLRTMMTFRRTCV